MRGDMERSHSSRRAVEKAERDQADQDFMRFVHCLLLAVIISIFIMALAAYSVLHG